MTPEDRKELINELESKYFLVKGSAVFYMLGGAIATAIAFVGITYTTTKSAINSTAAANTFREIENIRDAAKHSNDQITQILESSQNNIVKVPGIEESLREQVSALEEIKKTTDKNNVALRSFVKQFWPERLGFLYEKGQYRAIDSTHLDPKDCWPHLGK